MVGISKGRLNRPRWRFTAYLHGKDVYWFTLIDDNDKKCGWMPAKKRERIAELSSEGGDSISDERSGYDTMLSSASPG